MAPYSVSGVNILAVGAVRTERNLPFLQPAFYLLSRQAKKRTDNLPVYGTNPAHPGKPGSPEKMEQHGLRPVVAVMGHRNLSSFPAKDFLKRLVTDAPPLFLLGKAPFFCPASHVRLHQKKGNLEPAAHILHISRVLCGVGPDAVIDMDHFQGKRYLLSDFPQCKKEADRICAP